MRKEVKEEVWKNKVSAEKLKEGEEEEGKEEDKEEKEEEEKWIDKSDEAGNENGIVENEEGEERESPARHFYSEKSNNKFEKKMLYPIYINSVVCIKTERK